MYARYVVNVNGGVIYQYTKEGKGFEGAKIYVEITKCKDTITDHDVLINGAIFSCLVDWSRGMIDKCKIYLWETDELVHTQQANIIGIGLGSIKGTRNKTHLNRLFK